MKKYINGWSDGKDICLLYRDCNDHKKKIERIKDFKWYFLVDKKSFYDKSSVFEEIKCKINFIEYDLNSSKNYVRVYFPRELVTSKTRTDDINYDLFSTDEFLLRKNNRKEYILLKILKFLEKNGIEHYEADLSLLRRYISDKGIKIDDELYELYIDLECDDCGAGFSDVTQHRILSIMCYDARRDKYELFVVKKNTLNEEKELLLRFKKKFLECDVFYAWNGAKYDFVVLRSRYQLHGIEVDWRYVRLVDQLKVFKKYVYSRGEGGLRASYSLDNVARKLLGEKKVELDAVRVANVFEDDIDKFKEYAKKDVELMVRIEEKTQFLRINNLTCRIGNCFVNDYGMGDKIDGFMLRYGALEDFHFITKRTYSKKDYAGAYVYPPVIGLHKNVAVYDFKSLYPSLIRTFNISPETKVNKVSNDENGEIIKTITGVCFDRYKKGIVPRVYEEYIDKNRKYYADKQKTVDVNSDEFQIYHRQATAFKTFGLSFYGEFGNYRSRYFDIDIARTITALGQYIIKKTIEFFKSEGYEVLYGDTDSIFVKCDIDDVENISNKCKSFHDRLLYDEFGISSHVIQLDFEKYFKTIFFLSKKRYAGLVILHKGVECDVIDVRGLEYVRSDSIKIARDVQYELMSLILREDAKISEILDWLFESRNNVMQYKLGVDDVAISHSVTKQLNKYKTVPVHVKIAKEMLSRGREVYIGMKVQYVVINSDNNLEAVTLDEYVTNKLKYDAKYYWNRKLYPVLMRILEAVYQKFNWNLLLYDDRITKCTMCRLCFNRQNIVKADGSSSPDILFCGEAPGKQEDIEGKPFVGKSGKLLRTWIDILGLKKSQYAITNVVKCRPVNNRTPTHEEINACKVHLIDEIRRLSPKIIIAVGKVSRDFFLPQFSHESMIQMNGHVYKTRKGNDVGILLHPSYVLRSNYDMRDSLQLLREELNKIL